jgi:hypothetical protein
MSGAFFPPVFDFVAQKCGGGGGGFAISANSGLMLAVSSLGNTDYERKWNALFVFLIYCMAGERECQTGDIR